MLKLHQLEISGFKTFVDPVEVEFASGLTAVVGPNGCGKSNLVEAVTWVLGERSAKSLRGSKMEDVIFSGSAARKPLGMAEANLTLLADPSFEATENGRISIGRRVHRNGQSDYRLNGKRCRLKDIRDLLMDTGLGIRAYSVIEQGKIGLILSGKPQERRKLLEEAAGITRYKARRQVAEVKLTEAYGNLLRLDDTLSEIERGLRSLKRQAGSARRYNERMKAYRELLQTVLLGRWSHLFEHLDELRKDLAAQIDSEAEVTTELTRNEAELTQGREQLEKFSADLAERHQSHAEIAARIEGRQEFLKGSRQTLDEIAERIGGAKRMMTRRQEEIGEHGQSIGDLESTRRGLEAELEQASSAVTAEQERISTVEANYSDSEAALEEQRSRLLASLGELNEVRNRLHREQIESEKSTYRQRRLLADLEQRATGLATAIRDEEESSARLAELRAEVEQTESRRNELQERLGRLIGSEVECSERKRDLEGSISSNRQRLEFLAELAGAQAERRERLRQALSSSGFGDATTFSETFQVPEGWERALDLYFGELAEAAVLADDHVPTDLTAELVNGRGTARLIVRNADPRDAAAAMEVDDPALEGRLQDRIGLPDELSQALPPTYLVRSGADAQRLARRYSWATFLSRDPLCARAGIVELQGREGTPGILTREREHGQLSEQLPRLEQSHVDAEEELRGLSNERATTQQKLQQTETGWNDLKQKLAVANARVEDHQSRRRRLHLEHETLLSEREELDRDLGVIGERSGQLTSLLEKSESRHRELEETFDRSEKSLAALRQDRETARTSGVTRQGHLRLLETRLDSHDREHGRLDREITQAREQIQLWGTEIESLETRRGQIEEQRKEAETELEQQLAKQGSSQKEVLASQHKLDEQRETLKTFETAIQDLRDRQEALRGKISEIRVAEATHLQSREHLQAEFGNEFEEQLPDAPPAAPSDLSSMETELTRRREVLERMGPVNALAAEEYEEQEVRHVELTEQRKDVADSIEKLNATIAEIDATSTERFRATFEEVNKAFGEVFQSLFRGGEAEMNLLDEDDVLESGIEIVARPPGKRAQNIMLLSGGEKALTAIALLFALFRTKPSPFCILDEVDAPLDDINTMRFVELLKTMASEVQFIVITHNKITMEAVSRLYGVTMQERGVSNLVSVELDAVHPVLEEAQAATA